MYQYKRWRYGAIIRALKTRRVIILSGPRQCGKTTLAKDLAVDDAIYRTLDDDVLLEAALSDPNGFVRHNNELMIIDEVQKAPKLLSAVKLDVDNIQQPGRFLLTGSADIRAIPTVNESLAGRVSNVRLRPLSQGELHSKVPKFLSQVFGEDFKSHRSAYTKDDYLHIAFKGGFPEAVRLEKAPDVRVWYKDYTASIIERDLYDIINLRRQSGMEELFNVLAAWSSKFIDISAIGSGLGLSRQTLVTYISALEMLYLIERVRPWIRTDYERVNKHDKLFMTDPGMMAATLNWEFDRIRLDGDKVGKLIETFVFNELAALIDAQEEEYKLYHYRDREKREIDFIIENDKGDVLGVEVKAGSAVSQDTFKHLKWFRTHMAKDKSFVGIVLYAGEHVLPFGPGMWAVPINVLWE